MTNLLCYNDTIDVITQEVKLINQRATSLRGPSGKLRCPLVQPFLVVVEELPVLRSKDSRWGYRARLVRTYK